MTYKKIITCWIQVTVLSCIFVGNLHAGVTDGGVTAYRADSGHRFVMFTDNPADDPAGLNLPLGAGLYTSGACRAAFGDAGITGYVCSGTPGDTVDNFACNSTAVPQTDSLWCLFSENPRTGSNKAWAIKYSAGLIPTNDGRSIVRCFGTDTFDPATGCFPPLLPTQISVEGGYIKLEVTNGTPPPLQDCDFSKNFAHWGRMSIDRVSSILYICTMNGWVAK